MENVDEPRDIFLRQRAEELLKEKPLKDDSAISSAETKRLIYELQVHQIELEMQNDQLVKANRESEIAREKFAELYDFAPTGYFTLSREGEILEINLCASLMIGKERLYLKNCRFGFFISDDTKAVFNVFLNNVFNNQFMQSCEVILYGSGSDPKFVYLVGILAANKEHCLISAIDITEQRVAEMALKKSELLLKSSIESQKNTLMLSVDKNYNYLFFNKAYTDAIKNGYGLDIETGMNVLECFTSDVERNMVKENYDRALNGESHLDIRRYGVDPFAWYETFFNPIINEKDEIVGATALARDITLRIESEIELVNSRELYADLVANQSAGFYRINVQKMEPGKSLIERASLEFVSDRFCELLEIDRSELGKDAIGFILSKIYPEDFPGFMLMNEECQLSLKPFNGSIRLLIQDRIKWLRFETCPRTMDDGSIRWTGVVLDITNQKLAEEATILSEERYHMLLEMATDAFFHGNPAGDFIAVNQVAIEQTGYSREELLKMNMTDLFSAEVLSVQPLQLEKLRNGEIILSERDLTRKDGTVITVEMNSRMMPDTTFQSFFRDITERKRIEKALKRKLGELEIYYELAITRERKMIALKCEINLLLERLGEEPKY